MQTRAPASLVAAPDDGLAIVAAAAAADSKIIKFKYKKNYTTNYKINLLIHSCKLRGKGRVGLIKIILHLMIILFNV